MTEKLFIQINYNLNYGKAFEGLFGHKRPELVRDIDSGLSSPLNR